MADEVWTVGHLQITRDILNGDAVAVADEVWTVGHIPLRYHQIRA